MTLRMVSLKKTRQINNHRGPLFHDYAGYWRREGQEWRARGVKERYGCLAVVIVVKYYFDAPLSPLPSAPVVYPVDIA
jgi:hypothetical protein